MADNRLALKRSTKEFMLGLGKNFLQYCEIDQEIPVEVPRNVIWYEKLLIKVDLGFQIVCNCVLLYIRKTFAVINIVGVFLTGC